MKDDFLQHFVLVKSEYGVIECTLKQYKLWHILKYIHNSGSCTMFILHPLLTFRLYLCVIYIHKYIFKKGLGTDIYIYIYIYIYNDQSE